MSSGDIDFGMRPDSGNQDEEGEFGMSEGQTKAMQALETRQEEGGNGSGSSEHDPALSAFALDALRNTDPLSDDQDDIEHRIHKANEDLAREPQPKEEREKRIKFKEDLVEFEAPPAPDEDERTEDDDSDEKQEDVKKEGKVLIEKEGKFELVPESEVQGEEQMDGGGGEESGGGSGSGTLEELLGLSPAANSQAPPSGSEEPARSPSAPPPPSKEAEPEKKKERPTSAPVRDRSSFVSSYRPQSAEDRILARGHRSPAMIQEARDQAKQKKKAEEEAKQKEKEEKEKREEENKSSFEAWCKEKEKQRKEEQRQRREDLRKKREEEEEKDKDPNAFQKWVSRKNEQERRERVIEKCRLEEEKQWTVTRSQKESLRAYKKWLKQKRRQELEEKSFLITSKSSGDLMSRKSRKSAQIAQAIKMAEQFRFIDHYGYRF